MSNFPTSGILLLALGDAGFLEPPSEGEIHIQVIPEQEDATATPVIPEPVDNNEWERLSNGDTPSEADSLSVVADGRRYPSPRRFEQGLDPRRSQEIAAWSNSIEYNGKHCSRFREVIKL